MSRQNNSTARQGYPHDEGEPTRLFSKVLTWAKSSWHCIEEDAQHHRARGLVYGARDAYLADLSLDSDRKRLSLVVPIPRKHELSDADVRHLLKVQAGTNGLSSIATDEEDRQLRIHTQSVLAHPDTSREVVAAVFADTKNLLDDCRLSGLTGLSLL